MTPMTTKTPKSPRRFARQPKPDASKEQTNDSKGAEANEWVVAKPKGVANSAPRPNSKTALIIGLLSRTGGASLDEMAAATGWQPHTTRAALTGLRKKGHTVAKDKVDNVTRYSIAAPAQS